MVEGARSAQNARMPFTEVNGQRLYYEDSGPPPARRATSPGDPPAGQARAAPALVFSHGFLMDHEMFAPQVAAFSGGHRVVTWDERGHGLTESTEDDFSYWDSADDLRGLLDALSIQHAVVCGMSQGGFLSLRFALAHPERVIGLVLIDSQAGLEDPNRLPRNRSGVDAWATDGPSDSMVEAIAALIIGANRPESPYWTAKWKSRRQEGVRQIFRTLITRDDITGRLGEIQAPALIIHGEEDRAIEMARAQALAAGLPAARPLVRVPGAGHASNLTHPEPVNAAIASFLDELFS
jgi:pimeloyl-ACP methyl ester carboxylesterase